MFSWRYWLVVFVSLSIIHNSLGNVIKNPEQPEDETVNINIKNGAGLKISYPAGEIIVPSERKNVRIKTIDVFEEKNSPPQPPAPPAPPIPTNEQQYPRENFEGLSNQWQQQGNPYKWQKYFPTNQMYQGKRFYAPMPNVNRGKQNPLQVSDDEVFENDEDIASFATDQYDYYDEFLHKPHQNKNKEKQIQAKPNFNLEFFLDLLQQVVWMGRCLVEGDYVKIANLILNTSQNLLNYYVQQQKY